MPRAADVDGGGNPAKAGEKLKFSQATDIRELYDQFWARSHIQSPTLQSVWPVVRDLLPANGRVLEIGAGKRPRVPIEGCFFVDLSWEAGRELALLGASATVADAGCLPFCSSAFALVVAAEVLEHLHNDQSALQEWGRVLEPGGRLFLSVPLYRHMWTALDEMVGHVRRYEPSDLQVQLERAGFQIERYAVDRALLYRAGNRLAALGVALVGARAAMWIEGHLRAPLAERLAHRTARRLRWHVGLAEEDDKRATTAQVICRRR